jgi:hypothetical protein
MIYIGSTSTQVYKYSVITVTLSAAEKAQGSETHRAMCCAVFREAKEFHIGGMNILLYLFTKKKKGDKPY